MSGNMNLTNLVASGGLSELPFTVVLEAEGLTEEFADFPFEEFTELPDFTVSTSVTASLFDFGVAVFNAAGDMFDEFVDDVIAVTSAALDIWSEFIVGAAGADIQVAVTINPDLGEGTVASATAGSFFVGPEDANGFVEVFTSAQLELQTGIDLNGATPDVVINVNPQFLLGASFDVDPDRVAIPGVIDFVSVLAHEINHSLGFLSFRDNSGSDFLLDIDGDGVLETLESTYGTFVNFDVVDGFLTPTFNGANTVGVYGQPVILESTTGSPGSDISHFALFNPDGTIADTALALENPSVIPGDIVDVGVLELAVLADLGYSVIVPDDLGLVNTLDTLPFTPTVTVNQQLSANGDTVLLTLQFDSPSLFVTLPSSVGVTVTAADGTEQTLRATFLPGSTTATIELDADTFFETTGPADFTSITGDIDVTLFFPAQAQLENGGQSQTVAVSADIISGTLGNDDIDGGNGSQQLFGGAGDDAIDGGNGDDFIGAGDGEDVVDGGNGHDTVLGGSGNDEIKGNNGNDALFGGDGNDFIDASNGNDIIGGGDGNDEIKGDNGSDVIDGGSGDDTIESGNNNDLVFGGSGNDLIIADNGNDTIEAGAGSDTIEGGNGADDFIFAFGTAGDTDTVLDFGGNDDLVLTGFADFENTADVLAAATQVGSDIVITLDAATNQTLVLEGLDLGDLDAGDIRLAGPADLPDTFSSFVSDDVLGLL